MSEIKYVRKISLAKDFYKEQLIYNSNEDNFFPEYKKVLILNRQFGNKRKIIAKIETIEGSHIERNSDDIVKLIGEKQFEILFLALCSVINQEFRIKGILSILNSATNNRSEPNGSQNNGLTKVNVQCQTDEIRISTSDIKKRRIRKHLAPYVVQNSKPTEPKLRKLIIDIPTKDSVKQSETNNDNKFDDKNELPILRFDDENSNDTAFTSLTCNSTDAIYNNPFSVLDMVDNHTLPEKDLELLKSSNKTEIDSLNLLKNTTNVTLLKITEIHSLNQTTQNTFNTTNEMQKKTEINSLDNFVTLTKHNPLDDSEIKVTESLPLYNNVLNFPDNTTISIALPSKLEDPFHLVTKENMKYIAKPKLIELQMKIDEKLCHHPMDEDGNLPIHVATLNNDFELLKRQCFILNMRKETVDILANDLTALKLSLFQPSVTATDILLQFNADPLYLDENHSSYFHIAAELKTKHLSVLLHYCKMNCRKIISENDQLQSNGWECKTDEELTESLFKHICNMCDDQGYTPLMLASTLGSYENVKLLLECSKSSVNKQMPNTGNTALYLAVAACCNMVSEHLTKYRPTGIWNIKIDENIKLTIENLLEYGADPSIENYVGSNVTLLLTEFPISELMTLISNNPKIKNFIHDDGDFQNLMFIKENDKIEVKNINKTAKKYEAKKSTSNDSKASNSSFNLYDIKPVNFSIEQKHSSQPSNLLNSRKIAPRQIVNNTQKRRINILKSVTIKSPQTKKSVQESTLNKSVQESTLNKSVQESTKIFKPIFIKKDGNLVLISKGKSTSTDSIVATQSTNFKNLSTNLHNPSINLQNHSTNLPNSLQKNVVVIRRSIQKIDLVKEAGVVVDKVIKRKSDDDVPSTSSKLSKT